MRALEELLERSVAYLPDALACDAQKRSDHLQGPRLAVVEAVARLRPGVLGNSASPEEESLADGLLEYPHFTRPADFRGMEVPDVLRSGDHARIGRWRRASALVRTMATRPDLILRRGGLSEADRALLDEFDLPGD